MPPIPRFAPLSAILLSAIVVHSAAATAPRIAIVFDDLGYSTEGLARELLEIDAPLTFAVLPGLSRSEAFAEMARARGHEVILHVPLEPLDAVRHDPGEGALFVEFAPEENRRRLRGLLDGLTGYSGVSNHMGSRFSADAESVDLLLDEVRLKDPSLFVLDSRTTPHSVILDRARVAGMDCVRNNLFLDSSERAESRPRRRTQDLTRLAFARGQAVAIGHVRAETVHAVERAVEQWRASGIQLVGLSDLMR